METPINEFGLIYTFVYQYNCVVHEWSITFNYFGNAYYVNIKYGLVAYKWLIYVKQLCILCLKPIKLGTC
jgi:hypothetical protein